jgi:hypothetical protein
MRSLTDVEKRALAAEREVAELKSALQAIADDPDTNVEAAVLAKNTLASIKSRKEIEL